MPTALFHDLDEEKKARVVHAGLTEFAQFGYENSSTNRIVQRAGISKGSLFQYFEGKEDLYFYILDGVTAELARSMEAQFQGLPHDLFQRVTGYAQAEFTWYMQNPVQCSLITKAFAKGDSIINRKTEARYGAAGQALYERLLEDIDAAHLKWDEHMTANILQWVLKGFNDAFLQRAQARIPGEIESLKTAYVEELSDYLAVLRDGLIK